MDPQQLQRLVTVRMPYGKYQGRVVADLPGNYLNWFARKGFPPGDIGRLLALMHEMTCSNPCVPAPVCRRARKKRKRVTGADPARRAKSLPDFRCWLAMWLDLDRVGAAWAALPSTWMFGAAPRFVHGPVHGKVSVDTAG